MAKKKSQTAQKTSSNPGKILSYAAVFLLGFLAGIGFTIMKSDPPSSSQTAGQTGSQQQGNEMNDQILQLEATVTAEPQNFQSWVQLGHLYYDTNQPEKAIKAYEKSLELHSGDANLLTDLGVMYRRIKQPDQAIVNFDKAIAMDASHLPSRLNKGIVLYYDLGDAAGAIASWEAALKINPEAKTANGARIVDFVKQLKDELNSKK